MKSSGSLPRLPQEGRQVRRGGWKWTDFVALPIRVPEEQHCGEGVHALGHIHPVYTLLELPAEFNCSHGFLVGSVWGVLLACSSYLGMSYTLSLQSSPGPELSLIQTVSRIGMGRGKLFLESLLVTESAILRVIVAF